RLWPDRPLRPPGAARGCEAPGGLARGDTRARLSDRSAECLGQPAASRPDDRGQARRRASGDDPPRGAARGRPGRGDGWAARGGRAGRRDPPLRRRWLAALPGGSLRVAVGTARRALLDGALRVRAPRASTAPDLP